MSKNPKNIETPNDDTSKLPVAPAGKNDASAAEKTPLSMRQSDAPADDPVRIKTGPKQEKKLDSDIVEDPRRLIRFGMIVVLLFFGALGAWACIAKINGAVVGMGKVKVETERKTVQHLEGGIVESILVREGDEVSEGQTLIVLESAQVDASVDLYRKQLFSQLASQARLKSEKEWEDSITWPEELLSYSTTPDVHEIMETEQKVFQTRRDAVSGQISLLKSQIDQIRSQITGFEEQNKSEATIIDTLEEELKAKRQLYNERYLEKSQILELERQLATHKGNRGRLTQSVAEARQRRAELELRIADTRNRFVEDATGQLGRLENEILQTRDRIRPLVDAKKRLHVLAPVSGRVVGLNIHSPGGVVRPGEPLLDIVPTNTPLIVEMQVPVNKISDVYVGQDAQAQLDAFDTRIHPLIKAKVIYISADRHEEKSGPAVQPYYICHVQIDPKSLEDAKLYISPGMPATIFITTKARTVLVYMMEPLLRSWQSALRE